MLEVKEDHKMGLERNYCLKVFDASNTNMDLFWPIHQTNLF